MLAYEILLYLPEIIPYLISHKIIGINYQEYICYHRIRNYKKYLTNLSLPNNFKTYCEYYKYLNNILSSRKATIHLIKCDKKINNECDFENNKLIENIIKDKYSLLIPLLKNGDIIENLNSSGYRSNGIYFVKTTQKDFHILQQYFEYDDYGSINEEFKAFENIPLTFYYNCNTNNMYFPENNSKFYWHSVPYLIFDPIKTNIYQWTINDFKKFLNIYYKIFIHNNIKYLFFTNKINEKELQDFIENKIINYFLYEKNYYTSLEYYKDENNDILKLINNLKIPIECVFTIY